MLRADGADGAEAATGSSGLELVGRARDLRTDTSGAATVLDEASVRAVLVGDRRLGELRTEPDEPAARALLGERVAGGFRAALDRALPTHRAARSPLYLLLDDLPVAALISGYGDLYRRELPPPVPPTAPGGPQGAGGERPASMLKADICSGWRSDGTMMVALRERGQIPITVGPAAPSLEDPADPLGWHEIAALPPGAMRRRRLVDVTAGDPLVVHAMFRDTHADAGGTETVLHEYSLDLEVDPATFVVLHSRATPHVLPWTECPAAAASARRLEGQVAGDLRQFVRSELTGTSTCTHLNDLLRSVADVPALVASL